MFGTILLTEAELRDAAGDVAGADAVAREFVGYAARTHLNALLSRGIAILSRHAHGLR